MEGPYAEVAQLSMIYSKYRAVHSPQFTQSVTHILPLCNLLTYHWLTQVPTWHGDVEVVLIWVSPDTDPESRISMQVVYWCYDLEETLEGFIMSGKN